MDVFESNLEICALRLRDHPNIAYQLCNGFDFQPQPDASVTAIFCYDAIVHFSRDLVASYLKDARRVLKPGGMALLHHSNYFWPDTTVHYGHNPRGRNHMTQALFNEYVADAGLEVVEQILMDWELPSLDCLSLSSASRLDPFWLIGSHPKWTKGSRFGSSEHREATKPRALSPNVF